MKLYSLEPQTAVIEHPNDPDVKWEVAEPQMADIIRWQDEWASAGTNVQKFEKSLQLLAENTKRISGLKGPDGAAIIMEAPFEPHQFKPFFAHVFDTMTDGLVVAKDENEQPIKEEDGTFKLIKGQVRGQFPNYIVERLTDAETFSRPLDAGATPSTSSSTSS